jgi:hypothetical protein
MDEENFSVRIYIKIISRKGILYIPIIPRVTFCIRPGFSISRNRKQKAITTFYMNIIYHPSVGEDAFSSSASSG